MEKGALVSGYLMRLVTRGRAAAEGQSVQPLVRSTSPIAERDQRVGMMGFEGVDLGESSLAETGSETGSEQDGALQPPLPGEFPAAHETGEATVQRKTASPVDALAGLAGRTPPRSNGVGTRVQGDAQPTGVRKATRHIERLVPSLSSADATGQAGAHRDDWPVTSPGDTGTEAPGPASSQMHRGSRHFDRGSAVQTRSFRHARQADSTRLEPSARALDEHSEPAPMDSGRHTAGAGEGPRVVIGRINVEVVPPPAVQPSTAAPRPGPVTAASVSVIGPLGGGIRPNLRLSLRHR